MVVRSPGAGTYQAAKFEEDADAIVEYYRNEGYVMARVGQPELRYVDDSTDRRTRYVELRVPVTEGERYRVGDFTFDGNTVIKSEGLQGVFRVKPGTYYSEKKIRKSLEKAREVYGSLGYYEFTAYPDIKPREPASAEEQALAPKPPGPPTIDVTMRVQEGKQYFVNRITFVGNTTTRDNVIRREIRLFEGGVFNTEALKFSVKRLNQLGYFKQLEGGSKELTIDKTPGTDNQVDVKLKFEEQNRNQLTFGAGVSQYEGFFGQLSFQTSNFMGRGETFTVSLQQGSRARNYQVGFSEPFLFDRPITARHRAAPAADPLPVHLHPEQHGRVGDLRLRGPGVLAGVHDLQLRCDQHRGPERGVPRPADDHARQPRVRRAAARLRADRPDDARDGEPVLRRHAAARERRQAHRQQDHAQLRPQHGGQPDLPVGRPAVHGLGRPGGAWAGTRGSSSRRSRASTTVP